jgi:alcohol dehydrogenase class IV
MHARPGPGENRSLRWQDAAELAVDAAARLSSDLQIRATGNGHSQADIPMLAQLAYKDPQTVGNPATLT